MAIAQTITVVDGKTYQPGEEIWDLGSFACVDVRGNIRSYEGLSSDEEHSGTKDDPIPWRKNMQCYKDKYYIQNEIVYKCTRDSGNALQNDIIDLIGHYFEVA